jgi:hypothetical protein
MLGNGVALFPVLLESIAKTTQLRSFPLSAEFDYEFTLSLQAAIGKVGRPDPGNRTAFA